MILIIRQRQIYPQLPVHTLSQTYTNSPLSTSSSPRSTRGQARGEWWGKDLKTVTKFDFRVSITFSRAHSQSIESFFFSSCPRTLSCHPSPPEAITYIQMGRQCKQRQRTVAKIYTQTRIQPQHCVFIASMCMYMHTPTSRLQKG